MIKIKTFALTEDKEFNEFIKEHPARDENSVKFGSTNIVLMYEEGEPISKQEKLVTLNLKIRIHEKKILEYHQQYFSFKKQYEMRADSVGKMQLDLDEKNKQLKALKESVKTLKGDEQDKVNKEIIELTKYTQSGKDLLKGLSDMLPQTQNSILVAKGQWELEKTDKEATLELIEIIKAE